MRTWIRTNDLDAAGGDRASVTRATHESRAGHAWLWAAGAWLLVATVLVGACDGDQAATEPTFEDESAPPRVTGDRVQGLILSSPWQKGEQALTLRIEGGDLHLGSYQGRLQLVTEDARIVDVQSPSVGFHVTNFDEDDGRQVRFAGFRAEGFTNPVELQVLVEAQRPLEAGDLVLSLDVVGTADGEELSPNRIRTPDRIFSLAR